MNFLSRLFRSTQAIHHDPVFGELALKKTWWWGEVAWPHGPSKISLTIARAPEPPTSEDHLAFAELRDAYQSLLPQIAQALFSLWGTDPSESEWDGPRPKDPLALLELLQLDGILIKPPGTVELWYAFAGEVWPDAMFTVAVQGTVVEPVSLDD